MNGTISFNESWGCIDRLSHAIYQQAENVNWEESSRMAAQRHASIIDHFNRFPITAENSHSYQILISRLISLEKNIVEAMHHQKKKLVMESRSLHNQKQGIDAYHASGI